MHKIIAKKVSFEILSSQWVTNLSLQLTVLWILVEKVVLPKPSKASSEENKSNTQGMKWSFVPGANLLPRFSAKVERESKQRLNEFAKELRSYGIVDMSGNGEYITT